MVDILIIGAGPAGSNLARLLGHSNKNDYKVCLLDKRRLDLPTDAKRQKACGGLLSPDAQKILGRLGLTLPASVLEDPQFFKVRTIDFDNRLEQYYQRYYFNMDREKFDRYLFGLIPASVDCKCGVVVSEIFAMDGYWEVHYSDISDAKAPVKKVIQAKFLVGADGANSVVRRKLLPDRQRPKKYISIQKWYPLIGRLPYYTGIFDSEITDYYSWTIQKGTHLILGTAIPVEGKNKNNTKSKTLEKDGFKGYIPDLNSKFEKLERKVSDHLRVPLTQAVKTESAFIERSMSLADLCFSARIKAMNGKSLPLALLGEAAGATSPTSAEGFSYALLSSLKLFGSLDSGLTHAEFRYDLACGEIRRSLLFKWLKSPAMYWPKLRGLVIRSTLTSMKTESNEKNFGSSQDLFRI